jgi:hypothetical protein
VNGTRLLWWCVCCCLSRVLDITIKLDLQRLSPYLRIGASPLHCIQAAWPWSRGYPKQAQSLNWPWCEPVRNVKQNVTQTLPQNRGSTSPVRTSRLTCRLTYTPYGPQWSAFYCTRVPKYVFLALPHNVTLYSLCQRLWLQVRRGYEESILNNAHRNICRTASVV